MQRRALVLGAIVVSALVLSACAPSTDESIAASGERCPEGSDCYDPPEAVGEGGAISVEAFDLGFRDLRGMALEGDVAVTLVNEGEVLHNIVIEGANEVGDLKVEAEGGSEAEGTFNLFAGTFTFFCDVPGHRAGGMEATLEVYRTAEEAAEAGGEPLDGGASPRPASPSPSPAGSPSPGPSPSPTG